MVFLKQHLCIENCMVSTESDPCFRVEIEQFGHLHKHTFCADDQPFPTGVQKRVDWKPSCPETADHGESFLGTILNADPLGNVKYVFDQVTYFL